MKYPAYADTLRPSSRLFAGLYDVFLIVGFSFLLGLSAQLAVPIPFSPVPITTQTLVVLLLGSLLGKIRGTLCVLLYLIEGSIGLPLFSGGRAGIAHLVGPTGGYLFGFVAAAYIVGSLSQLGWDRKLSLTIAAMFLGNIVIYIFGLPWLGRFVEYGQIFSLGLYPFIIGDLLKIIIAASLAPGGWKLIDKLKSPQG